MSHLPHLLQCSYGHVKVFDLQFCKTILKVRSNTAHFLVYGELVRLSMETIVKKQ